jgi:large subunit ribosomal protein L32e
MVEKEQAKNSKPEQKDGKAVEKPKQKKEKKSRKVIIKASKEIQKLRTLALSKTNAPVFRGRFGKRKIRRKSKAKWDKWRFPRGIDVNHEQCEGFIPRIGYLRAKAIRHLHPSGYKEVLVSKPEELKNLNKNTAIRIMAGIGRKKKIALVDKAIEMGIKVLNP